MKKVVTILLCTLLVSHIVAQKTRYNLMFTKGQNQLSEKQKEEIKKISTWIKPKQTISIFPLTYDTNHDRLYFPRNAKDQAAVIAEFAKTIGFEIQGSPRNFPTSYKGLSVAVNMTFKNTKLNNRLSDLFPEKPSQYFIIDPTKDTMIIGNEGTKLMFEAQCLMSTKKVKIELKEFYGLDDYIKGGLPTTSNGQLIQTGGSMYLDATELDNPQKRVIINPNKGVGVDFTIGKNDPEMQVFIKDPRFPDQLNWILPKSKKSSSIKKSWQMTETIYNSDMSIQSEQVFNSKEEWEAHLQKRKDAAEKKRKEEEIKRTTQNKMDSKLKVYNLGYINCDKFYNETMAPFAIAADQNTKAEYYLVFKDVRGVMKGSQYNQQINFGKVPINKDATLIAVSFIDKQAYFFNCNVNIGNTALPTVTLKPVEENFLNEQLALLK